MSDMQLLADIRALSEELTEVRQAHRAFRVAILQALGWSGPWDITVVSEKAITDRIRDLVADACASRVTVTGGTHG